MEKDERRVELNGKWYRRKTNGDLVAEANIKSDDKKRDRLVESLFKRAGALSERMAVEKGKITAEIMAYLDSIAEEQGVNWKGNTQLKNFTGDLRLDVRVNEKMVFNEKLQLAKQLIDECLRAWSTDANPALVQLVEQAFSTEKGSVNRNFVLSLRRMKITAKEKQEEWTRAMELIADSVQVESTKTYFVFKRLNPAGDWETISLDFANITPQ